MFDPYKILQIIVEKIWAALRVLIGRKALAAIVLLVFVPMVTVGAMVVQLDPRKHPASYPEVVRFLRVALASVWSDEQLVLPDTAESIRSIESRLRIGLLQAAAGLPDDLDINAWSAAQMAVALRRQLPPDLRQDLLDRITEHHDPESGGWFEFTDGKQVHTIVSVWALLALRDEADFDPGPGLRYLLEQEINKTGGWPVKAFPDGVPEQASTYATAMALRALSVWMDSERTEQLQDQMRAAIHRGVLWLANRRSLSGSWADYPDLPIQQSASTGATAVATVALLREVDFGAYPVAEIAMGFTSQLPSILLRPWDKEVSGEWFLGSGAAVQDAVRIYPAAAVLGAIAASYCHLPLKQRFQALDYLDWYVQNVQHEVGKLATEGAWALWIHAEFLVGLSEVSDWKGCEAEPV